jgi:transposase
VSLARLVQEDLKRDPHIGDLYVFRGRRGDLVKIIWHDGQGDRGRFVWPVTVHGVVALTAAQMSYLLEAIDWRNPQHTWRPQSAGQAAENSFEAAKRPRQIAPFVIPSEPWMTAMNRCQRTLTR